MRVVDEQPCVPSVIRGELSEPCPRRGECGAFDTSTAMPRVPASMLTRLALLY